MMKNQSTKKTEELCEETGYPCHWIYMDDSLKHMRCTQCYRSRDWSKEECTKGNNSSDPLH